jgi:hypothetical protein
MVAWLVGIVERGETVDPVGLCLPALVDTEDVGLGNHSVASGRTVPRLILRFLNRHFAEPDNLVQRSAQFVFFALHGAAV